MQLTKISMQATHLSMRRIKLSMQSTNTRTCICNLSMQASDFLILQANADIIAEHNYTSNC